MPNSSKEYANQYYADHKEKFLARYTCEVCKCELAKSKMRKHERSLKHQKNEAILNGTYEEKQDIAVSINRKSNLQMMTLLQCMLKLIDFSDVSDAQRDEIKTTFDQKMKQHHDQDKQKQPQSEKPVDIDSVGPTTQCED